MTDFAGAWLQDVDWRVVLTTIHIAGMMLALTAASAGYVVGARVLFQAGARPQRGFLRLVHAGVVVGLGLLWLSGGGLIVTSVLTGTLPADMIFKLGVAALVSVAVLLVHEFVLPLVHARRRPLAAHLSWAELFGVCAISAGSVACWLALIAYGFSAELQALSVGRLFTLLLSFAGASILACMLMAVAVRFTTQKNQPGGAQNNMPIGHGPSGDDAMPAPLLKAVTQPMQRSAPTSQTRPAPVTAPPGPETDALAQRFRQTLAARQSNDNPKRPVRERPEHERSREARPIVDQNRGQRAQSCDESDDDRLLHKWLRGSQTKHEQSDPPISAATEPSPDDTVSPKDVMRACRRALIGAGAVSFVSNMLMLTGPLFMLQIYDRVLTSKSLPTLTALFMLAMALFAFLGALDLIRSRLLVRIGLRVDRLMAPQVFERAIEVGNAEQHAQRLQLHKDLQQIRHFVSGAGSTAIFDMPWAPVYFGIVLMFHWALGAVALVGAATLVALSLLNELMSRKSVAAASRLSAESEQLFEAGRRNSEVLQAMGMSPRYRARWLDKHSAELLVMTKAADAAGLLSVLTKTSRLILQSAMLAMGAYLVLGSEISPGVMIASSIIMSRALAPVELAIAHWRGFVAMRQGMSRLSKEFSESEDVARRLSLPAPQGHLEIDNVFAGPVGVRDPVLKGLAFQLQPGDALGVLGPSGSGKSTLARVLVGFGRRFVAVSIWMVRRLNNGQLSNLVSISDICRRMRCCLMALLLKT